MPRNRSDTYELLVVRCTDLAVCVRENGDEPFWLPFSQITDPDERYIRECVDQEIEIEIPDWLAREKGLL